MSNTTRVASVLAALGDGIEVTAEECASALTYLADTLVQHNAALAARLAAVEAAARHAVSSLRSIEVTAGNSHEEITEIRHRLELDLDPLPTPQ